MKKKFLSILLAATMVVGVTGCGGSTDNGGTSGSASKDSSKSSSAGNTGSSAAKQEDEKLSAKLTVWSPAEDQDKKNGSWLQTMCEKFNEAHPNWDLTFDYNVCSEADAKSTVTQDPSAAADVYMYASDNLPALVSANAISKLGGETVDYVKNTNSDLIVNSVTYDGSVYGVPFTSNTWYMYYDKSVFSEDDIKSLDTMLKKGKVSFPLNNSWYIASFYTANGATLFGADGLDEEAGIDLGDGATAVTDYLVDLVKNKNFVNDKDGAGLAGLKDKSVNALFSGSWDYKNVKDVLGKNIGVAALPTVKIDGKDCQMKSFAASKAIGVNPNCKNQQVAVALAAFLGSAEAQQAHYEARGIIPCNKDLLADEKISKDPVAIAETNTVANTSILQPGVAAMDNYWSPAENFGNSLLSGDVTHKNAAKQTKKLNESMNTNVAK